MGDWFRDELLHPVRLELVEIRCSHFLDRRQAGFETDKHKAQVDFLLNGRETMAAGDAKVELD